MNDNEAVSESEFKRFVAVQKSGVTNMFDVNRVSSLSGLPKDKIFDIMKNYGDYAKKFNTEGDDEK